MIAGSIRWMFAAALAAATPLAAQPLAVDGTEFVVTGEDGSVRRSAELVGMQLDLPNGTRVRIDAVERETAPGGGDVWLHTLSIQDADASWQPVCEADPDGRSLAFPLPGRFADDGRFIADRRAFSLTCTSGARGKCVRFGYAPWGRAADGTPLHDHYDACVRMVRADYCGDGVAHTRNGTIIDLYDRVGIQSSDGGPAFRFEAGWTPEGAVCVQHPRIAAAGDLAALQRECPRLATLPACTETVAAEAGALLFNRSR